MAYRPGSPIGGFNPMGGGAGFTPEFFARRAAGAGLGPGPTFMEQFSPPSMPMAGTGAGTGMASPLMASPLMAGTGAATGMASPPMGALFERKMNPIGMAGSTMASPPMNPMGMADPGQARRQAPYLEEFQRRLLDQAFTPPMPQPMGPAGTAMTRPPKPSPPGLGMAGSTMASPPMNPRFRPATAAQLAGLRADAAQLAGAAPPGPMGTPPGPLGGALGGSLGEPLPPALPVGDFNPMGGGTGFTPDFRWAQLKAGAPMSKPGLGVDPYQKGLQMGMAQLGMSPMAQPAGLGMPGLGAPPSTASTGREAYIRDIFNPSPPGLGMAGPTMGQPPIGPAGSGMFSPMAQPPIGPTMGMAQPMAQPAGQAPRRPFPNQFTGLGQGNMPSGGIGTFGDAFKGTLQWPFGPR